MEIPDAQEVIRLWEQMQIAAAAWMKAKFARTYRRINLQQIDASISLRANEILEYTERQKIKSLRTTIGLTHLDEIYDKRNAHRLSKYRALLRQQKVIGIWRQHFLESSKPPSVEESTGTPS